jgi:hypothetical protein
MPRRSDDAGHIERHMTTSASGVQALIAALEPCAIEKLERGCAHRAGKEVEPLLALFAARNGIGADDRLATS